MEIGHIAEGRAIEPPWNTHMLSLSVDNRAGGSTIMLPAIGSRLPCTCIGKAYFSAIQSIILIEAIMSRNT